MLEKKGGGKNKGSRSSLAFSLSLRKEKKENTKEKLRPKLHVSNAIGSYPKIFIAALTPHGPQKTAAATAAAHTPPIPLNTGGYKFPKAIAPVACEKRPTDSITPKVTESFHTISREEPPTVGKKLHPGPIESTSRTSFLTEAGEDLLDT